jgi:hypothetical protein
VRFTRRTYRKAIKRSFDREFGLFSGGTNTTSRWYRQMQHTRALRHRQMREGKA